MAELGLEEMVPFNPSVGFIIYRMEDGSPADVCIPLLG